jgi:mannose-1-phosphate guanylyltransferase/mannose-6-phosphate isomerase
LGVPPNAPETGFGYVKAGAPLGAGFAVEKFVEKPDRPTAQAYLDHGGYYWNAGVFVTGARVFLDELARFAPQMKDAVAQSIERGAQTDDRLHLEATAWATCPSDSIDYAVAEKTSRAAVLPLNVGWSDVGSWSAIWDLLNKDAAGNVPIGDVMLESSTDCLVRADSRLVAIVGLKDVIVVETPDAVLIVGKDSVQDIKKIVQRLTDGDRIEARVHAVAGNA